jgi:hypothetical protein
MVDVYGIAKNLAPLTGALSSADVMKLLGQVSCANSDLLRAERRRMEQLKQVGLLACSITPFAGISGIYTIGQNKLLRPTEAERRRARFGVIKGGLEA